MCSYFMFLMLSAAIRIIFIYYINVLFTESAYMSRGLTIGLVIAMVSSVILFTTISFVFGCILGQLWQKRKQSTETSDTKDAHLQSSKTVEHASSATGHTMIIPAEHNFEMMKNAAYGPLKWTTTK